MKNQLSLPFLFWCSCLAVMWSCKSISTAPAESNWFVQDGQPVNVVNHTAAWTSEKEGLSATGPGNRLDAGLGVGKGNFELFAEVKIDDVTQDNASLMLDAAGPIETGELIFSRDGQIVVRGFFFGDRTQKVRPADPLVRSDEWFRLRVKREADTVSFFIADTLIWAMEFAGDRSFGKLSFQPGQSRMTVRNFGLTGSTTSLEDWIPPLERKYPVAGQAPVDVFVRHESGYHTYRIPALVRTLSGTLLAFAEGRKDNARDHGNVDIVLRRSEDGGRSWEPIELIYEEGGNDPVTIGNPVPVVDRQTGHIFLFFCRENKRVLLIKSEDNGLSWTAPRDLTQTLKREDWGDWYATGPCHGIQLANGRLVVPANHGHPQGRGTQTHMILSDDHGLTWRIGGIPENYGNETTVAETGDNQLYVNMRSSLHNNRKPYCREVVQSVDGGASFGPAKLDCDLPDSICQGSVLSFQPKEGARFLIFSNPAAQRRERLSLRTSFDGGRNWGAPFLVYGGSSAYSDLVQLDEERIGVLFERDWYHSITFSSIAVSKLPEADGVVHGR